MSAVTDLVNACQQRGIVIAADGEALRVDGPDETLTENLLSEIKARKTEILAALNPKINRWRVTHVDGQITEHSSAGLTRSEALEMSRRWGEPVRAEPIAEATPSPPSDLGAHLPGISPEFAARLSAEDLEDIATGDIPLGTVQAFEQAALAREAADLKESFEEPCRYPGIRRRAASCRGRA